MAVKATLKNGILKCEFSIQKPKASASGKNLVLASTRGQFNTGLDYEGSEILLIANAYIENTEDIKPTKKKHKKSHTSHRIG